MDTLTNSIKSLTELIKSFQNSQQEYMDKINNTLEKYDERFKKLESQQEKLLQLISENKNKLELLTQNTDLSQLNRIIQENEKIIEIKNEKVEPKFKLAAPFLDNLTAQSVFEFFWTIERLNFLNKDQLENSFNIHKLIDTDLLSDLLSDNNISNKSPSDKVLLNLLSPFATIKSIETILQRTKKLTLWSPLSKERVEIFKSRILLHKGFINNKLYDDYEPYFILSIIYNIHLKNLRNRLLKTFFDIKFIKNFDTKEDLFLLSSKLTFSEQIKNMNKIDMLISILMKECEEPSPEESIKMNLKLQSNIINKSKVRSKRNKFTIVQ